MDVCANCQHELTGPFCSACGQRDVDMRRAIWHLVGELVAETFELDGRLAHTLPLFLLRPGRLVEHFVAGRRQRFTSPVRILVFALAFGFVLLGMGGQRALDSFDNLLADRPFVVEEGGARIMFSDNNSFSVAAERGTVFEENLRSLEGMNQRQASQILLSGWFGAAPSLVLLLVPLFTLLIELLFPRYLVVEHLVLSTLLHAQGLILGGLAAVSGSWTAMGVVVLWLHGQLLVGMHDVYRQSWGRTAWKWALAVFGYWVLWIAALLGALGLALYDL